MADRELGPWSGGRGLSPFNLRDPFAPFRREMDRLFDDFFTPAEGRSFAPAIGAQALWPRIDLEETDQAYIVTAEVPGLDEKNIELSLRDNILTISGEKREERSDADKVDAKFKNGVLAVTLPKSQKSEAKARRIEVKPGK
jgi:HSP20 family protein